MDLFSIKRKELEFFPAGFAFCSLCKLKYPTPLSLVQDLFSDRWQNGPELDLESCARALGLLSWNWSQTFSILIADLDLDRGEGKEILNGLRGENSGLLFCAWEGRGSLVDSLKTDVRRGGRVIAWGSAPRKGGGQGACHLCMYFVCPRHSPGAPAPQVGPYPSAPWGWHRAYTCSSINGCEGEDAVACC